MLLEVARRTLQLARPFETSYGDVRERATLVVTLRDEEGLRGRGEAAPLEPYDGVSLERAERALRAHAGVLGALAGPPAASDEQERWLRGALDECARADALPQALAAIDVALWELAARSRERPLWELLAELVCPDAPGPVAVPASVPVSATVAALDRAGASALASEAARAGYPCLKVKVGAGDDAGRLAAVRAAAGPDIALRLDANGAWQVEEAIAAIGALAPAGLELVEEPVHGTSELREVRERVEVRIAADESANAPGALEGAVDAVCLKLAREWRHHAAARPRRARTRVRLRGLSRLDARGARRHRRRRACRRRARRRRADAAVRARHARAVHRPRRAAARRRRRDRRAAGSGARRGGG